MSDAEKTVIVDAHLLDTATGKRAVSRHDYPETPVDDMSGIVFHWTEGNYACDCNRSLFMARALGEEEHEIDCNTGENRIVLGKLVDVKTGLDLLTA